jgi:hypothetical protein
VARSSGARRSGAAIAALVVAVAVATAGPGGATPREVGDTYVFDGAVSAAGTISSTAIDCDLDIPITSDGTVTLAAGGQASWHVDLCASSAQPVQAQTPVYGGDFTLTSADGTVSGTVTSTTSSTSGPQGFATHLDLVATGGTGALVGATGTLTFDGFVGVAGSTFAGDLVGTVTIAAAPTTAPPSTLGTVPATVAAPPPAPPAAAPVSGSPTFTG